MVLVDGQRHKSIEQIQELRNRLTYFCQLIFDKGARVIQEGRIKKFLKKEGWTAFSTNGGGATGYP